MEMAENAGEYELPEDAEMLFDLYRDVYEQTGGLVTPLVGQLLSDTGYDAAYSLNPKSELSAPPLWEESLVYAFPKLTILQPVLFDLGAAGKGYLVDIVSRIIIDAGVTSFCVNAGGDIYAYSQMGVGTRCALEHPDDPTLAIGIATITNQSICGSAGNRRAWDNYHHIINPKTLISPRHIRAVWVVAESALLADILTTCLFFVAPSILSGRYSYEYLIVYEDHSIEQSPAFPAELFKN
jgi:thiamine biosynthesis lipoprotein